MPQIAELYAKITGDSSQLQGELGKTKTLLGKLNDGFKSATGASLTSFIGMAGGVASFVGFVKDSIKTTVNYANQVSDLKRIIGASAEESSRLIQVADDVRIDYGTLETAMKGAITKGFEPSIDGLKLMAQEYLSIQDPIERSAWLIDTFGKSGLEMGRLMELGAAGIETVGEKAKNILTEEDLTKMEDLRLALDDLDDASNTLKGDVALLVAGPLTWLMKKFSEGITLGGQLWQMLQNISAALPAFYESMGLVGLGSSGAVPGTTATPYGTFPGVPGQGSTGAGAGGTVKGNVRRAIGGPVSSGMSYLVGERGPERFTPSQSGNITPNENTQMDLSTSTINQLAKAIVDGMTMARA